MFTSKFGKQSKPTPKGTVSPEALRAAIAWATSQTPEILAAERFDNVTGHRRDNLLTLLETANSTSQGKFSEMRIQAAQKELIQVHQEGVKSSSASTLKGE